ncbi:putative secreted protein [Litoreibacter meonggei]|uniref:Putative secreted protein n=1 Tax=Litoreibacter meonggei TaxID=1049199 RepID=A0A497X563_9RHOB|nr:VPLPA-CTERM sorting domain-containing protein [Litoreibacter meonggei]RLJ60406.1 putative secreted protein [Litoreibacter meonggei]
MKRKNIFAAAAASASILSGAAYASPVTLTYSGLSVNPAETVDLYSPRSFNNLRAGGFNMSDGTNSFVAWCIDLFDTIGSAVYDQTRPAQVSDSEEADLNRLFSNNRSIATDNAVNSAAFQVAVWEIVYETGSSYDVGSGDFRAGDNTAVTSLAQNWLSNLGTDAGSYKLSFYESSTSQDLVSGAPVPAVPLPAGLPLLLVGVGALALTRKRRS